jgi:ABC-type transport system involved in cytochrome c biogenesis permease subunit
MTRRCTMAFLPAALLLAGALGGAELDPLGAIAVQDGGRLKPLDTFARETARRVSGAKPFTGGERVAGLDPAEWVLSMVAAPARWKEERMFRVAHAELRGALRLEARRDRYSFAELMGHAPFMESAWRTHEKLRLDPEASLDPVEQEIATLYDTLSIVAGIFSGEALRIVPDPQDAAGTWASVEQLGGIPGERAEEVRAALAALVRAYQSQDRAASAQAAARLQQRLAAVAPAAYPVAADLRLEVRYNRQKPFRAAWVLYLLAFFLLLASFPLRSRVLAGVGLAATAIGFLLNSYGLVLRVLISGRAPVTNMYESVVYVAWGVALFALIFEAVHRPRYVAACAAALGALALILADNLPILSGAIEPLVPVLRDNMWLTLHVLTITLGYAAFLLAMGLGHVSLGLYCFTPQRTASIKSLSAFLHRALQAGTLLLAAGTLLGGVWASYSWGRFWGWDPKETWALIALLGYLAVLHGRFLGWLRDFGMAVGSILGFLGVLMAWYGVNYILGTGLHSYGFGAGGLGYVTGFVALEAFVVGAAFLRRRSYLEATAAVPARLRTNP